jgi:hypothetical protein
MVKQMISFTVPQRAALKRDAAGLGISIAELVRRIVDEYMDLKSPRGRRRTEDDDWETTTYDR